MVFRYEGVVSGPREGVDLGDRGDLGTVGGRGVAVSAVVGERWRWRMIVHAVIIHMPSGVVF